jgi:hypothetical protein
MNQLGPTLAQQPVDGLFRTREMRLRLMDARGELIGKMFAILLISLAAAGCQSGAAGTSVRYDNVRFMDVWATYTRCLSTEDPQSAARYSMSLQEMSERQTNQSPLEDILPATFKQIIAQPSSRLAVDVHAMAASCSLHTGTLALSTGEHDLAKSQFTQILNGYAQSEYSYYAEQALARLAHPELSFQAFLK